MILSELIYWSVSSYCRTMGESDNASDTMKCNDSYSTEHGDCGPMLWIAALRGFFMWSTQLAINSPQKRRNIWTTFSALQIDFSFRVFVCAAAYTTASFTLYLSLSVSYMYASFSCAFCLFFLSVFNFSVVSFLLILSFQIYLWFLPLHSSLFAFNALFL